MYDRLPPVPRLAFELEWGVPKDSKRIAIDISDYWELWIFDMQNTSGRATFYMDCSGIVRT